MDKQKVLAWLQQPSSVAGISAIAGALAGVVSGQITWENAVPVAVGGLVAILMPDNTAAKASATVLATDAVKLAAGDKAAIGQVVADSASLVAGLTQPK